MQRLRAKSRFNLKRFRSRMRCARRIAAGRYARTGLPATAGSRSGAVAGRRPAGAGLRRRHPRDAAAGAGKRHHRHRGRHCRRTADRGRLPCLHRRQLDSDRAPGPLRHSADGHCRRLRLRRFFRSRGTHAPCRPVGRGGVDHLRRGDCAGRPDVSPRRGFCRRAPAVGGRCARGGGADGLAQRACGGACCGLHLERYACLRDVRHASAVRRLLAPGRRARARLERAARPPSRWACSHRLVD